MLRHSLLAAGACAVLAGAALPVSPGLTFGIRSTTSTPDGTPSTPSLTRVQFLDGVLRFDAEDGSAQRDRKAYGAGSYWLVTTAARSMALVIPTRRQYWEARFDSTAGILLQAMAASAVITDIEVSGSALGNGGVVNGYPTKRFRITTSFAEARADDSEGPQKKVHTVEQMWVTDALKDVPDPMEAFTRAFGGKGAVPPGAGVGTVNELMQKRGEVQRRLFTGLPIKTITTTTTTSADGEKEEETSTVEIVDLKRVDLDAAGFRVPEGYAKVDLNTLVREAVKEAAKESAKEGAKESAKDAAKDAIKGVFGRRRRP